MKWVIICVIPAFFCLGSLSGQVIPSSLNIGIGPVLSMSRNDEIYSEGKFTFPSLYGNYPSGKGISVYADYKLTNLIWMGVSTTYTNLNNWKGNQKIFLRNPSVHIYTTGASINIFPGGTHINSGAVKPGINISTFYNYSEIHWAGLNKGKNDFNYGYSAGICMLYENDIHGVRVDAFYQHSKADSKYYVDRYFDSVNLRLSFYFRRMKNIYYSYE
jgi:hypothetical protein